MPTLTESQIMEAASKLRLLILDVDGVMTDGRIFIDNNGVESKAFNVRDGHGIKMLQRIGVEVAIITGRKSDVVKKRAEELGIKHVYQRSLNKLETYEHLKLQLGIADSEAAFVGDDLVDLPVMRLVALSVAVADADSEVCARADWVTKNGGGSGAVREVTDLIIKASGRWDEAVKNYMEA